MQPLINASDACMRGKIVLRCSNQGNASLSAVLAWADVKTYPSLAAASPTFLHPHEQTYFLGLPALRRKTSYLIGRYVAKQALAELLNAVDARAIHIMAGVFQQPVVHYPTPEAVDVSISHCDRLAVAVAFPAIHPMAVDVELIAPQRSDVMAAVMLVDELERALPVAGSRDAACTLLWAAKEALSKTLRCGMTCPFELFAISQIDASREPITGLFRNFAQYRFHAWIKSGFVLVLVAPRNSTLETDLTPVVSAMETA